MYINLEIPDEVGKLAKTNAAILDIKLKNYYNKIIKSAVEKDKKKIEFGV